ncbi:MAG: MFS transporter [bacterium]
MLASALTVMSGAVVAPALPRIAANFLGDPDVALKSRLLLTLPALGVVLAGGLAGWAADRFGRLPVMQVSLVVYAVAGSTGLYLEGLDPLLMGRLVLGLGVAGIMTTATTLVADLWPGPARMRFLGLQAAFMGLGGLVFMTGGGALADQHWRAPFALYLASLLLLVPALVSFRVGAPSTLPAGGLVGMPAEGDKAPTFLIYLAAMLGYGLFYAIPTQLPFSLQERLQASSLQVGLAVGSSTVVSAVFSLMSQRIIARLGAPRTVALTFALVTAGFALLAPDTGWALVFPAVALVGAGTGLLMPNLAAWLASGTEPARRGRAMGGLTTASFAGMFASPLLLQPVRAHYGLHGLTGAFAAASALAACTAGGAWLMRPRRGATG